MALLIHRYARGPPFVQYSSCVFRSIFKLKTFIPIFNHDSR